MSISMRPGVSFEFGEPVEVSKLSEPPRGFRIGSVTPDGRRFLGSQAEEDTQEPTLTILTNWNGLLEP